LQHIIFFLIPIAAILSLIIGLYLTMNYTFFLNALSMISIELFSPFSVELSAPFGAAIGLGLLPIISLLLFVNIFASLFVLWNFDLLRHIPKIGRYLDKFDRKVLKLIEKHNLGHISFFALFLYFLSPFQASGVFTIAIIGRLLNMSNKKIIVIVILGTIIGSIIFSSPIYGIKLLF